MEARVGLHIEENQRRNIMSTKKTQNYQLHQWEATDDFLRTEFNENFGKLDEALGKKTEVVIGVYIPDNTEERFIDLGFTPKAVLVVGSTGEMGYVTSGMTVVRGGLALPGHNLSDTLLEITTNGFMARNWFAGSGMLYLNYGEVKYYLAFR